MPWKECSVMDERLRFVARLLDGEAMSEVCRALGISHKTRSGSVEQPYADQRQVGNSAAASAQSTSRNSGLL